MINAISSGFSSLSFTSRASADCTDCEAEPETKPEEEESSASEKAELAELKARDREVRSHEQAHKAAGGAHASAPSYTYQRGPDGNMYAVGGEVQIDTAPVSGDPEATIAKAQTIRAAAMAPMSPSAQDRKVAAAASRMETQARMELAKKEDGETGGFMFASEPEASKIDVRA